MMRAKIISRTRQYELANDAFYELKNILTAQDEIPGWVKDYIDSVHRAMEVRVANAIIAGAKELEGIEDYEEQTTEPHDVGFYQRPMEY